MGRGVQGGGPQRRKQNKETAAGGDKRFAAGKSARVMEGMDFSK